MQAVNFLETSPLDYCYENGVVKLEKQLSHISVGGLIKISKTHFPELTKKVCRCKDKDIVLRLLVKHCEYQS